MIDKSFSPPSASSGYEFSCTTYWELSSSMEAKFWGEVVSSQSLIGGFDFSNDRKVFMSCLRMVECWFLGSRGLSATGWPKVFSFFFKLAGRAVLASIAAKFYSGPDEALSLGGICPPSIYPWNGSPVCICPLRLAGCSYSSILLQSKSKNGQNELSVFAK